MDQLGRTRLLLGQDGMEKLQRATVALFGLGGVGGYALEALARSGVGHLVLVDHDTVSLSNLNRQILATHKTVGMPKVQAGALRVAEINPAVSVTAMETFFLPDTASLFDFSGYDYVIDAIDTVTGKMALIEACRNAGTPIICSMGTGNKLDASAFRVEDIYKTSACPLARIIRKECRKRGIEKLKVVYSQEEPLACTPTEEDLKEMPEGRNALPGSCAFVPGTAGLILAGQVIRDLTNK